MQRTTASSRRRVHLGLATALLLGVVMASARATEPALPPAEYALFSALLKHGLDPSAKQAVIADTSTGDPARIVSGPATEARAKDLGTTLTLLTEWTRLNQRTFVFAAKFTLPVPYALMSESDRDLLFRGDDPENGWKLFHERYPGSAGLIRLSRAALDTLAHQALVYLEFQCGPECGSGRLVQLTQTPDGGWQVDGGELIWIAGPAT